MAIKVLLLGTLVALAAASLRPSTPDELYQMVLWAQRVQEGEAQLHSLHDKQTSEHKPEPRQKQRVSTPPPPPPPPRVPQHAWSPPPFVDDLELLRPGLPAHEEYDRSLRFSHSFLHGFRDAQ